MRFVIFSSIFLLVMALMNFYTWRRFLRLLSHRYAAYLVTVPVLLMLGDIFFILDIATGIIPDSPSLYLVSSAFVGMSFMMFIVALLYDLTLSISRRVPFDQERRRILKVVFDVTMLIMAFAYLLRGFAQGVRFPEVNQVRISIRDFPFKHFSIVQITDVHVGRTIKRDFVEQLVARTNSLNPDLVVITGDLFDLPVSQIEYDLYPLKDISAPVYFVLGNHEYFHGPGEAIEFLRELGISPLLNESVRVGKDDQQFNLVGINDLAGKGSGLFPPDPDAAFANIRQDRPCIVLAHQPRAIHILENYPCNLMLSGHTHGGQIFPFGLLVMTAQPYLAGLYQHADNRQVFVSRGTGYWGPPLRVLAPSEISLLEITHTETGA